MKQRAAGQEAEVDVVEHVLHDLLLVAQHPQRDQRHLVHLLLDALVVGVVAAVVSAGLFGPAFAACLVVLVVVEELRGVVLDLQHLAAVDLPADAVRGPWRGLA